MHSASHGLYGANFGLIQRSAGPIAVQCCFSTPNAGADQRVQSRIQELAPVRHRHPRIAADRQAPPPVARLDQETPSTCALFPATGFLMLFAPSFQRISRPPEKRPFS